jgi:hypothetical protein
MHNFDLQAEFGSDDIAGLARAPVGAGDYQVRIEALGDALCGLAGLLASQVGQGNFGRNRAAAIAIAFALTVPNHNQLAHCQSMLSRKRSSNNSAGRWRLNH